MRLLRARFTNQTAFANRRAGSLWMERDVCYGDSNTQLRVFYQRSRRDWLPFLYLTRVALTEAAEESRVRER